MGGDDDAVLFEKGVLAGGLRREHVEGGAGDLAGAHGLEQVVLVDDAAAGGVHDADSVLHGGELVARDHAAGGGGERGVDADEVALGVEAVKVDGQGAEGAHAFGGHEGVMGDHVHLEGEGAAGHLRADWPEADKSKGVAAKLGAHEGATLPLTAAQRAVGAGDVASEGDEQGEGVLGGGDGVAAGRVHDDDAALGGGVEVDVVDARAGARDHLQAVRVREGVGRDLRLAAHDEALVASERLAELVRGQARAHVDIGALLQQGDAFIGDGVGDEDAGAGRRFGHGAGSRKTGLGPLAMGSA